MESQDQSLWEAIRQASQPAFLTSIDGEGKDVLDLLRDHSYHVFVRQKSEQLASEATVPDSVTNHCQIDKHGTGFFFFVPKHSLMF